ncbi:hypothetical protein AU476_33695 [Cupriavidus sp. UYMSc13B]|nr:hypothetical protein AU476_33695 [Cupriavidus sp. UYMSc13B]
MLGHTLSTMGQQTLSQSLAVEGRQDVEVVEINAELRLGLRQQAGKAGASPSTMASVTSAGPSAPWSMRARQAASRSG